MSAKSPLISRTDLSPVCRTLPFSATFALPAAVRGPVANRQGLLLRAAWRSRSRPSGVRPLRLQVRWLRHDDAAATSHTPIPRSLVAILLRSDAANQEIALQRCSSCSPKGLPHTAEGRARLSRNQA
jgi:hypothetical protein